MLRLSGSDFREYISAVRVFAAPHRVSGSLELDGAKKAVMASVLQPLVGDHNRVQELVEATSLQGFVLDAAIVSLPTRTH